MRKRRRGAPGGASLRGSDEVPVHQVLVFYQHPSRIQKFLNDRLIPHCEKLVDLITGGPKARLSEQMRHQRDISRLPVRYGSQSEGVRILVRTQVITGVLRARCGYLKIAGGVGQSVGRASSFAEHPHFGFA